MDDDVAVLQAASGSCKTMCDNTLRIAFDFEPRDAPLAFRLFGERGTGAAIALLTKRATLNELLTTEADHEALRKKTKKQKNTDKQAAGPYGQFAARLYRSGFFYAPKILRALGTDGQYRIWIQRQPSAYSLQFSEWINGDGRCVAAHVRRSNASGVSLKPEYSCIPLTDEEHRLQHEKGENAFEKFDFEKAKNSYLISWAKSVLYNIFCVESLTEICPTRWTEWCAQNDLTVFLPRIPNERPN